MKREDLKKNIKEKILFVGESGEGKTEISMYIAKLYAIAGKTVLYIDPEAGTDKSKEKIFSDLSDEELDRIELVNIFDIKTYLKYMLGWNEEVKDGTRSIKVKKGVEYDLKICDGLTTEIDLYKTRLTSRFVDQGYYEISGSRFNIDDPETFMLPYQFYGKLYDQIKDALITMLEHRYDLLCTMHPVKDTKGQEALKQSIYQKFDSVIKLNKIILPSGSPKWGATIIKNRGRESTKRSNILENTDVFLKYYTKKFNMDIDETMEKLGSRFVKEKSKKEVNAI